MDLKQKMVFDDNKEPYQVISGTRVFKKNQTKSEKQETHTLDKKCEEDYKTKKTRVNARFIPDLKYTLNTNLYTLQISKKTSD